MRIVFMGTPDFAVPILKALITAHEVTAVVTQPGRPKGRGRSAAAEPPAKRAAVEHGIPVFQPETLRDKETRVRLRAYGADAFVVAAYGLLLPRRVLDIPPSGCINVHASLLPEYRGAAPAQHALMDGREETGVTIMYMDKGMDTGDIILQRALPIPPGERCPSLLARMSALGAELIIEALALISTDNAPRIPQDGALATYAPMITKEDGRINWNDSPRNIINKLRALDPWPGAYTSYNGQVLKIWDMEAEDSSDDAAPGAVLAADARKGILVQTGGGAVWLTALQYGGGKRMTAADYLRGHTVRQGEMLE